MEEQTTKKLEGLIADQIDYSKKFNPDTKEHTAIVGNIATLYKAYNEFTKTQAESNIRLKEMEIRSQELDIKRQEVDMRRQELDIKRQDVDIRCQEVDIKRQEMSDADYDREKEREMRASQQEFDKKARWIGYAVTGAELVIPLVFNGVLVAKGFKFEETGTTRSFFFKNILQNQLRFKK